jgi:cobalt-zinc-cadmium efflux system membrane fusion protein
MKPAIYTILMFIGLLPISAAGQQLLQLGSEQIAALEVEVYRTGKVEQQLSDPLPATVVLSDQHQRMLSLPVTGTVQQLRVLPGATVEVGTELGTILSREALGLQREYLAAHDQQARNLASKQRDQALYKGGAISAKRWQQTLAEWRQGEALLRELESQLSALGFNGDELQRLRTQRELRSELPLRSPIGGVVMQCSMSPGEAFSAGQELFHIGDTGHLWLALKAPQALASTANSGDKVYLNGELIARVLQVGAAIDPASQSVLLTAELSAGGDSPLLPGQSVLVQVGLEAHSGLWLPRDSIVSIGGATTVFVAHENGYEPRPVKVVAALDGWAALGGLSEGDMIVKSGSAALKGVVMGLGEAGDNAE